MADMERNFTDVLYHTNVLWLNIGNILKRVWDLKAEIHIFLNIQDISCDFSKEMKNDELIFHFEFALEIIEKLNERRTKLQGKGVFGHELHLKVKAFQLKLRLFAKQLNEKNIAHFPLLKIRSVSQELSDKYS